MKNLNDVSSYRLVGILPVLIIFLLFDPLTAFSQTFTANGKIIDATDQEPIAGATVLFVNVKDSLRSKYATTNENGVFLVKGLERAFHKMVIQSLGYQPFAEYVRITANSTIRTLALTPDVTNLEQVEIKGQKVPVEQKGDTTVYDADAFTTNPDATAAELVSKMPGISVSGNGVEANGEQIQQILLDGKRFFGQDPLLALNTIPANMINKVEVFDQQSERARVTGFDDGNTTKTMNVVTKPGKKQGVFGLLSAGGGTNERYQLEGNVSRIDENSQLTLMGMSNNINKTNFTDSDITGSRRRGRGRGGSSQVPEGITQTETIGANYSNEQEDTFTLESNYFYDESTTENAEKLQRETFLSDATQLYNETNERNARNRNHRLTIRSEVNLDDRNTLLYRPNVSYQQFESTESTVGETLQEGEQLNNTVNNFLRQRTGMRWDNSLLYSHKFKKTGRSFYVDLDGDFFDAEGTNRFIDDISDSTTTYQSTNQRSLIGVEPGFVEPVGASGQLEFSYEFRQEDQSEAVETFISETGSEATEEFIPGLSNRLTRITTYHEPEIGYSLRSFSKLFGAELALQHATLDNEQGLESLNRVNRTFLVLLPRVFGRVQLGEQGRIFFRYSTETEMPRSSQLQEVIDNSNPLFYSTGNTELDQSYTHFFFTSLRTSNADRNTSFSNFFLIQNTSNYITTSTTIAQADTLLADGVVLQRGAQLSRPVNTDGFWFLRNRSNFSLAPAGGKLNINTGIGGRYTRTPGLINGRENISENYRIDGEFKVASNFSDSLDFNVFYRINASQVTNSVQQNRNSRFLTHEIGGRGNWIIPGGWVVRSDINYQIYNGINDDFNVDYVLWNAGVAKKLLKDNRGELEIQVYDLLKQNQSRSQEITANAVQEQQALVLQQYVMLSFRYRISAFKK
mgnify:FL=1